MLKWPPEINGSIPASGMRFHDTTNDTFLFPLHEYNTVYITIQCYFCA